MLLKLPPLQKKNTVSTLVIGMEERIFRPKDSREIQFDKFPQCPRDRELCLWEKTVLLERWEQALETCWLPLAEGEWALITSEGSQVQVLRENERTEPLWCTAEKKAEYTGIFLVLSLLGLRRGGGGGGRRREMREMREKWIRKEGRKADFTCMIEEWKTSFHQGKLGGSALSTETSLGPSMC